jgi:cytosine deaminase
MTDVPVPASAPAEAVMVHAARTLVMKDGVVLHN